MTTKTGRDDDDRRVDEEQELFDLTMDAGYDAAKRGAPRVAPSQGTGRLAKGLEAAWLHGYDEAQA